MSILLAFWIQAWWEAQNAHKDEIVVLAALAEEFNNKKDTLKVRRAFNQAVLGSTNAVIRAAVESDSTMSASELDQHLATFWWYNFEDEWDAAVLDGLINGGQLTIISNPTLRINLAGWPKEFQMLRRRVGRDEEYWKETLMPFLARHAYLPQVYEQMVPMPGSTGLAVGQPPWNVSQPGDNLHLLDNQEFINILTEKVDRHQTILDLAFDGLDKKLDETIGLLELEIAN